VSSRRPTPAAAPAARQAGDVEEAICAAAERLMATRPFGELSVADILEEAEVSRASFYFYFASKHALLARLAERISTDVFGLSQAWLAGDRVDSGEDPRTELRASIAGALGVWEQHTPVLRAVIESGPQAEAAFRLWEQLMTAFTAAATARIERDRAAGLAPAGGPDARTLAASLMWMTERALYLAITGGEPAFADRERLVETLADVWWRAVYARA
jgi:AcrR family transcriptional regulator